MKIHGVLTPDIVFRPCYAPASPPHNTPTLPLSIMERLWKRIKKMMKFLQKGDKKRSSRPRLLCDSMRFTSENIQLKVGAKPGPCWIRLFAIESKEIRPFEGKVCHVFKLSDQQKCSDSVLHEARIISRHFATAQCPDKKGRRCGLTQLTGYPPPDSKSNTSKRVERKDWGWGGGVGVRLRMRRRVWLSIRTARTLHGRYPSISTWL